MLGGNKITNSYLSTALTKRVLEQPMLDYAILNKIPTVLRWIIVPVITLVGAIGVHIGLTILLISATAHA